MPAEPKDSESRQALSAMLRELSPEDVSASRKRRDMAGNLAYLAMLNTISAESRRKESDSRRRISELFRRFGEAYIDNRDMVINSPEGSVFMVSTENDDGLELLTHLGGGVYGHDRQPNNKVFFGVAIYKDSWDKNSLYVIRPGERVPLKDEYDITLVDLPEEEE